MFLHSFKAHLSFFGSRELMLVHGLNGQPLQLDCLVPPPICHITISMSVREKLFFELSAKVQQRRYYVKHLFLGYEKQARGFFHVVFFVLSTKQTSCKCRFLSFCYDQVEI